VKNSSRKKASNIEKTR